MTTTTERDRTSGRLPAYRPPQGQRSREVLRGLLSVLAILAIVIGVPAGLLLTLGSPLPTTLPSRESLTGELDPLAVLRIVSAVVWLAWAHFVVCLVVEWRSERRGVGLPSHVPLGGGSQAVARRLVAAMLLLAGTAVLAAPFVHSGAPAPRPAATASANQSDARATGDVVPQARSAAVAHEQAVETRSAAVTKDGVKVFYDVAPPAGRHHDSLWDIAERYLGDGRRYKEIFDLNAGRDQPDGQKLTQARLIRPGWVLLMPADATGPGLRVEQRPSLAVGTSGQAGSTQQGAEQAGAETGAGTHDAALGTEAQSPWRAAIGGSLLAAGLLASLRRTRGASPSAPDETGAEEALRLAADEVGAGFLDRALRGLVPLSVAAGQPLPEVYAACLGHDRLILSVSPPRQDAPAPWTSSEDGRSWTITRGDAEHLDVADDVLAPYPGLACFGEQDAWRMLFDLESAPGVVSLGGDPVTARSVAASVAVELATNPWSDAVRVTLVGFGDALDGLAPGRLRHADRLDDVLPEIEARLARQVGTDSVLRGRGERPDRALWAPEFIVLSAPPHPGELVSLGRLTAESRRPCGVVTVGDVPGARWRFVVSKDGTLDTGVLGLTLDAQLLPVESYRSLVPLFAGVPTHDADRVPVEAVPLAPAAATGVVPSPAAASGLALPERHLDVDAPMPVEVRLLGTVDVTASGQLEPERRELVTELVALLALSPEGAHPNVISSALWPRGVAADVREATLAHAQGWLGRDSAGRPRLRQDASGRWVLDRDVRCDWQVFRALAMAADRADAGVADRLRERALGLVRGPAFEGLPAGRYSWLGRLGADRDMRADVVRTAHTLAAGRLTGGDHAGSQAAARSGLQLLPESELLWRDVLLAGAGAGNRDALVADAEAMYGTLARRRATPQAETDALVDELLPGFRRRAA